eukprot:377157-Hanusia_phi.AAC.1
MRRLGGMTLRKEREGSEDGQEGERRGGGGGGGGVVVVVVVVVVGGGGGGGGGGESCLPTDAMFVLC